MSLSVGTKLGRYEIRSLIGAGGMGEVYLATDTELDRTAAIKILPEELASDPQRLQRFVQEAKSASALNHPHIITIYEIGGHGDSKFIATEYIDGDTLRKKMNQGIKLFEVLEIAAQIANALAAAHAAGIVHRDIKPENIMIRRDGYAKILDFGLAKLTETAALSADGEAPTRAMVNTGAGTVMGTASYMSPEQAKGVQVDARTDLWSLGVLLYEMATGHLPFPGETPTETISLILQKEPPPIARYADDIPEELDRIVTKALTKDLDERYQSAKDMLIDLKHLKRKLEVDAEIDRTLPPEVRAAASTLSNAGPSTASGTLRTVETGNRASSAEFIVNEIKHHKKFAIGAVVAAIAIAALGLFYLPRRTPALTEKDTILLADFVNTTGDGVFDGTLKQALSVQLGQSPYLNIFPDDRVNQALRFMGRNPGDRITRDIAKEICQRQGLKAMILGSIASLGSHYVVTLEAVNANQGDSLAREQVEAESKEQVLTALGKAATSMREKLGESLTSLKKFDAPIEQATTSSLEALKAFTQASELRQADHQNEAIGFLKKAIEIDPNFAMAYARLGVTYNNLFQADLAEQYSQKAYDLRDRVSERERYYIEEKYTSYVTGDRDEAIKILKAWEQDYPNDFVPHNNLGVNYSIAGRYEESLAEMREAIRLSPNNTLAFGNLVEDYIRLNRFDEAQQVLRDTLGQNPDRGVYRYYAFLLAFIRENKEAMKTHLDWLANDPTEPDYTDQQANIAAYNGQWRRSLEFTARSIDLFIRENRKENAAQAEAYNALLEMTYGRCEEAKKHAAKSLEIFRAKTSIGPSAYVFSMCTDPRGASMIEELQKRYPKDTFVSSFFAPMTHAAIELNRNNFSAAIDATQPGMRIEFGNLAGYWLNYLRGQIFLKAKMANEAALEFKKILDHRGVDPTSSLYPLAHLGLARALVATGDTAGARREYQDFLAIWKDADADLPVLIEAKKEYEQLK